MKKALALLAATALLASAALTPAVGFTAAAEINGSITITDSYSETYAAYQIFSGTITVNDDDEEILTSIEWGASIPDSKALLTALQEDSVIGSTFSSCTTAEDVATVIKDFGTNSDNLIIFANIVAAFCDTASATSTDNTISGLDSGYYLVAGTAATVDADGNTISSTTSRYILTEVNGSVGALAEEATAKNALPTVQKFVWDEEDDAEQGNVGGWGESADHDTYETFQFALEATLPANNELSYYNNYQITFHDKYNEGIEPDLDNIKVYVTNDTDDGAWKENEFNDNISTYTYVDITNDCTTVNSGLTDGCSFEVTVDDLVASLFSTSTGWSLGETKLSVIVVYDAVLNQSAEVWSSGVVNGTPKTDFNSGTVDDNVVYLTYSNNPNYAAIGESTDTDHQTDDKWEGLDYTTNSNGKPANKTYEKDYGTTTKDYVWLFTYEIDITKTDEFGKALEDAEFSLTSKDGIVYFIKANGIYWVTDSKTVVADTTLTSDENGKITIKGLDAGIYTLSETKAPTGYNQAEAKTVTIDATHLEEEGGITVSNTLNGSDLALTIVDKSGTTLPTTGGIGTTVFYVIGGIIVVGAGVLLITRKRANNV